MDVDADDVPIQIESVTPPPLLFDDEMQSCSSSQVRIRQESVTPPRLHFNDELPSTACLGKRKERKGEPADNREEGNPEEDSDEEWEAELDDSLNPSTIEI